MKLYRIENGLGTYWVVAEHPTEAQEKVEKMLDKYNYGFSDKRKTIEIHVVADEAKDQFLTNKFLVL